MAEHIYSWLAKTSAIYHFSCGCANGSSACSCQPDTVTSITMPAMSLLRTIKSYAYSTSKVCATDRLSFAYTTHCQTSIGSRATPAWCAHISKHTKQHGH